MTRYMLSRVVLAPSQSWTEAAIMQTTSLYVVRTGCAWRQLPVDFPPWQTVYWYFVRWEEAKVTEQMLTALRRRVRAAQGRAEEPMAGTIDSQSVKGADTVGRESRGYDAGKKVNGRKRFIVLTVWIGQRKPPTAASRQTDVPSAREGGYTSDDAAGRTGEDS
ncbi:transposase [Microbispora triticiradicis]|uniref:Transposase n=2 Tax=Microbispora triticiradicis TaxID=2200763 RepID=A0ABX9LR03_9ACTN|nr:transposase [Microbispora triticiradicis]